MSGVASSGRVFRKATSGADGRLKKPPRLVTYFQTSPRTPRPWTRCVVGDVGVLHAPDDAHVDVIAEILADGGQRVLHRDAVLL